MEETKKPIGPNFADELKAAGISGDGIAWGSDGDIAFGEEVDQAKRTAVMAVYAAHDPAKGVLDVQVKARLVVLDALLTARGIRELGLGAGIGIDYIEKIPPECGPLPLVPDAVVTLGDLVAAHNTLVTYLRAFPKYGTGMDKLRQVEALCVAEREKLAPK